MKRLIPGFVAAAVLLASLPAAAQEIAHPGWLVVEGEQPEAIWEPVPTAAGYDVQYRYVRPGLMGLLADGNWLDAGYVEETTLGIPAGEGLQVRVRSVSADGDVSIWSSPPPMPTGLTVTRESPDAEYITVSWDPTPGAQWYEILTRRQDTSRWTTLADHFEDTTYTFRHVATNPSGYSYLVGVRACNEFGCSWQATATIPQYVPPAPPDTPADLTATPGDGQVTVSWPAVERANSYDVQVRPAGGTWSDAVSGLAATSYTVTGLENGKAYEFRVRARNNGGTSNWSTAIVATPAPPPPPPPPAVIGAPGDGQVTVSWQPVDGAESYDLDDRPAGADSWNARARGLTQTSYTVTGLENGKAYEFRVRAVSAAGAGDWSNVLVATPKAPPPPPPPPPYGGSLVGALIDALPEHLQGAVTTIAPFVLLPACWLLARVLASIFMDLLERVTTALWWWQYRRERGL